MVKDREAHEARLRQQGRVVSALAWALGIVLTVGMCIVVVTSSYQLQRLSGLASDTKRNSDRLVDCTTPGGKCFEQGRNTTSGAVGTINKVTVSAVYCSGKLGPAATIAALDACVVALTK